jgi:ubiquinone/menaquinone biosynthesis C-methylase UbiE
MEINPESDEESIMSYSQRYVDPQYLEAGAARLKYIKERSYTLMQLQPGHRVLDVGCGPGIDTVALAQLVGPRGHVSGVDHDTGMITEADKRAEGAGVQNWVAHYHGDATALPFETTSFAACRSERVFQHLARPEAALAEMVRVTKFGGWIVVADPDWGTLSLDTREIDIERRLMRFEAEQRHHSGYVGRQLYRLFSGQQLRDITVEAFVVHSTTYSVFDRMIEMTKLEQTALTAGVVTTEELKQLHADLERVEKTGGVFSNVNLILVAGRKP